MTNKEVAEVLEEIAVLLELSGENPFKARAYVNVARTLEQCPEEIETLVRGKRLREIKGVGDALEKKLTELVTSGTLKYHEDLRAKFPDSLFELFKIPGLGAKRIKALYADLGIASLAELDAACRADRLSGVKGFGKKTQENILEGIAFAHEHVGQFLANAATEEAERLRDYLRNDPAVTRIEIAGSIRRCKEIVKDIDILVATKRPQAIMERFINAEGVASVTAHGDTKSSVVLESGIAADLRAVSDAQFPYALHYFTGSKAHNVALRQRAKAKGLKLNEYGLFRGSKNVPCADEAAIYAQLDLPYIPPELREDMGEFEAESLPGLVDMDDLTGMFHCHSTYSDGKASIEAMAKACKKLGYRYLVLADHSQSAAYAGGLTPDAVAKQHAEIEALNKRLKGFRVIKGIESDIRKNGALDYEPDILSQFEFVFAAIHSHLTMQEAEATARVVKAIESPLTDVLAHPSGRLLLEREGYPLDMDKVFDACLANHVAIEINASPQRLDLDWRYIRRAKDKGIKFCIGPDAHSVEGLGKMRYGVGVARKGWLEPGDLLNGMTAQELAKWRRSS